jgi:2-polyprenyl-3-methyl-5-hydroxy-6-metoxy-1,4-benzoquinol methylase
MAAHHSPALDEHDLAEMRRSAEEARAYTFTPANDAQINRYLNPPSDTPYGLEYAFYLLGDIRGKIVLDLGCGKGENLVPLALRGAEVRGLDLSPDLLAWAKKRISTARVKADLIAGSAYHTGLPDESVDVIFCIALIHHLEITRVRDEMRRILKKTGFIVLSEPIRFSRSYDRVRKLLQPRRNISEYEHPLTRSELEAMTSGFLMEQTRYFRLPFVPLIERISGRDSHAARILSASLVGHFPPLQHFATGITARLTVRKQ